MMSTQALPYLTPEQYLEIERAAEIRSEYLAGAIYAMAGASVNHGFIVSTTGILLGGQLRGKECGTLIADTRLFVRPHNLITYPDVFVVCPPFQVLDGRQDTLINATVIVEVLSPATKNSDRGEKFRFYRGLPSFREYLLLEQDQIHAEHHARQTDGSWLMREYSASSDEIQLASIGCSLRLADVYERVRFETAS